MARVGEPGLPVTFRTRDGGASAQGWVREVRGGALAFFENGPFGGQCEVPLGDIDTDSVACWLDGEFGWLDWREPFPE